MFNYPENHNNIVEVNNVYICLDCGNSRVHDLDKNTLKVVFVGDENAYHQFSGMVDIIKVESEND